MDEFDDIVAEDAVIKDERLKLIFMCLPSGAAVGRAGGAHPARARRLATAEIARAFRFPRKR